MTQKTTKQLYKQKQLLLATAIGGLLMASSVIGLNLWAQNKKHKATAVVTLGVISQIFLIIIAYLAIDNLLDIAFVRQISLLTLLIFQATLALILKIILHKKRNIQEALFPLNLDNYGKRNSIALVVFSIIGFFSLIAIEPFYLPLFFIYTVFHIYEFNFVSKTFNNTKIANGLKTLIVSLACFYPLTFAANWITHLFINTRIIAFEYIYLSLVIYIIFLFYVSLFVLAIKALALVSKSLKLIPLYKLKKQSITIGLFLFTLIGPLGIVTYGYIANNNPIVSKYSITIPKKSSDIDKLKIVCIADLHLKNTTNQNFINTLTNKLELIQPDLILIPGDIVESYGRIKTERMETLATAFNKIKPQYGTFAILGNHDGNDNPDFYRQMNMTLLKDSVWILDGKFQVLGLKYRGNQNIRPIDSLINDTVNLPVFLLDHAPYCLSKAIENNIDIQFSGHTHHGQVWPFNYITSSVFELDWGYKKIKNTHLFVTCGLQDGLLPLRQSANIPIRLGSYSEIIEVDVYFK